MSGEDQQPHGFIWTKFRSWLSRPGFARSVAVLAGGTALGQAITIAASPMLVRLFSPDDFGLLAVYTSLTGSVAMVSSLTYQQAIPLPDDATDAANVFALSLALATATAIATGMLFLLANPFALLEIESSLAVSPWIVCLGILGLSTFEIISQWAVRIAAFSALARTALTKAIAQVGVQLAWGSFAPGPLGLPLGQLAGQWTGSLRLTRLAWRESQGALRGVSVAGMWASAKRHSRFPQLTLPAVVLNAASQYAPALMLAHFFGADTAGLYALQERVTMVPVALVGSAAMRVFTASATEAKRHQALGALTRRITTKLLRTSLPFMVLLAVSAPSAFAILFGAEWREAGEYAQWLSIASALAASVFPITPLIYLLERQGAGTLFQVALLVSRAGAILIGGLLGTAVGAVAMAGVAIASCWLGYLTYLVILSGGRIWPLIRLVATEFLIAAAIASPVLACRLAGLTDATVTTAAAVMAIAASAILLRRLGANPDTGEPGISSAGG